MTDEKWVSVKDEMPGIGKKVQVTFSSGRYEELNFKIDDVGGLGFFDQNGTIYFSYKISHWRYPIDKRPDFSKCNDGDFVYIITNENKSYYGIIYKASQLFEHSVDNAHTVSEVLLLGTEHIKNEAHLYAQNRLFRENIKKITRINLEKNTFEEI